MVAMIATENCPLGGSITEKELFEAWMQFRAESGFRSVTSSPLIPRRVGDFLSPPVAWVVEDLCLLASFVQHQ